MCVCVCVCVFVCALVMLCLADARKKTKRNSQCLLQIKTRALKLNHLCSLPMAIACNKTDAAVWTENRCSCVDE